MIRDYVSDWLAPSEDIVYHMDSNLRTQLSEIVHETFMKYIPGGLHALVGYVHRPSSASATHLLGRSIVEECLDQLKDLCLHRIREAFDREKTITATLQIRRFEAYKDIYEEHYLDQQQNDASDILHALGEAAQGFVEHKLEETVPGFGQVKSAMLGSKKRHDLLEPMEGKDRAALQIMAEVRSYYDRKYPSLATGPH